MAIKMIAVDMDGTFLNAEKSYNRTRFLAQYQRMKNMGIHFVVASGNQYYQLISFFPEIAHEISFIAENGAWVVSEGRDMFNGELTSEEVKTVTDHLVALPGVAAIACGKHSGYTLARYDEAFKTVAARHYHRLEIVESFDNLQDVFFKFALNLPDSELLKTMDMLTEALEGIVVPVSSGHGSLDLIIPGLHKAHGLRLLQRQWNIADEEVVAFGDGGNDIEMLRQVGFGFAMANAQDKIKAVTPWHAASNNEEGVLEVIDQILARVPPFDY